jgi:phage/plasmid-like protein (TIGR03299 family)
MAHNINTMFYSGQTPWHKQGVYAGEQEVTSAIALEKSGLDWEVELIPVQTISGLTVPDTRAIVRKDNQAVFGTIGKNYVPFQNKQAFGFLDSLVGKESAVYHTAGALGQGEKVWILLKFPEAYRVGKDDLIEQYFLSTFSHDGSQTIRHFFTPIRVVCQNTLHMAMSGALNKGSSIKHTGMMQTHLDNLRTLLTESHDFFGKMQEISALMLQKRLSYQERQDYYMKSLSFEIEAGGLTTRQKNTLEDIQNLEETGKGTDLPEVKGSLWGSYNAMVEYVDFVKTVKGENDDLTRRTDSILFGNGRDIKESAFNLAVSLVG